MNSRITLGLLVVFVALAVAAVFTNRSAGAGAQGTPTPNMGVFSFQPTDVQTLKITYGGKTTTVQQDSSGNWKLVAPPAQYSDSTHIAGVVATMARIQKDRDVPMGTNSPSTFGLNKPYLSATATLKDGSQHTLVVGNKNPGGSGYYAQLQGQSGLFIVPIIDVDTMAQIVTQPPIATPTAATTPLATPAAAATASPTP